MATTGHIDKSKDRPAKIIAIGGAKGGIGKSLFAANLGVYLSRQGKRAVLADFDLGAANLHLLLGKWSLDRRLDDYLNRQAASLEAIRVKTQYGPDLIGGGGGRLGSANIHFSRKLKLLREIRKIDADYVILDLGGDTSFNVIDFYLAADTGIVLTTCDPTSYLDAYSFIKIALYRKLARIYGLESRYREKIAPELVPLFREFAKAAGIKNGNALNDLRHQIETKAPEFLPLLEKIVKDFSPYILINMVSEPSEAYALIERLKSVTQRMLSIQIRFLGGIPFDRDIQKSARDLSPEVSQHPCGMLAKKIKRVADLL